MNHGTIGTVSHGTVMITTIAAKDVREGDYLYNSHAYHPSAAWVRVTHIESLESGNLLIGTPGWYTVLNREEGITVKRREQA